MTYIPIHLQSSYSKLTYSEVDVSKTDLQNTFKYTQRIKELYFDTKTPYLPSIVKGKPKEEDIREKFSHTEESINHPVG